MPGKGLKNSIKRGIRSFSRCEPERTGHRDFPKEGERVTKNPAKAMPPSLAGVGNETVYEYNRAGYCRVLACAECLERHLESVQEACPAASFRRDRAAKGSRGAFLSFQDEAKDEAPVDGDVVSDGLQS
jgi:hypothetical protein